MLCKTSLHCCQHWHFQWLLAAAASVLSTTSISSANGMHVSCLLPQACGDVVHYHSMLVSAGLSGIPRSTVSTALPVACLWTCWFSG